MRSIILLFCLLWTLVATLEAQNIPSHSNNSSLVEHSLMFGIWSGNMTHPNGVSTVVRIEIECTHGSEFQGQIFFKCNFAYNCFCTQKISGHFEKSNNKYYLEFSAGKALESGGNDCTPFTGVFELNLRTGQSEGFTSGGYQAYLRKTQSGEAKTCNEAAGGFPSTPDRYYKACSCCDSTGKGQICAACGGDGYEEKPDAYGIIQSYQCSGISCDNGRLSCYCCGGSGKSRD